MKLYKVLSVSRESVHGGSYRYPRKGRWTRRVEVAPCHEGYHLARVQDLPVWVDPGRVVWEAEGEGDGVEARAKIVFPRVRLLRQVGALSDRVLRLWACDCAVDYNDDERDEGERA